MVDYNEMSKASRKLSDLRDTKPRPLNKLYGPNPTAQQVSSHKVAMSAWSKEYNPLLKKYKKLVETSNMEILKSRGSGGVQGGGGQ